MLRAQRLYQLILLVYPREFRCEFGPQMLQVFRDCYREEQRTRRPLGSALFWLLTLGDLARTATQEHLDNLRKENSIMNIRKDALALLGCLAIIVLAFLLLSYGRRHEVSSILVFGFALDALVTAGVVGNFIIFVLVKTTKLNPLRTALWTFLVVNAALLLVSALIGSRVDPQFRLGSLLIGYVVSFLFWFGLHWIWAKLKNDGQLAVSRDH